MKQILLIDAFAWIYRSFYAVRSLSNSKGVPSNAVFAMLRFLLKLQDEYPDCDGAFVFDAGKPVDRLAIAPLYKANRPPMPEELKQQLSVIHNLIGAFGWNEISCENQEADDIIGCIVNRFANREIRIVSGDKDLSQLIHSPRVEMLTPSPDGKALLPRGDRETLEKFGVPPAQITDYLALIGDTSDNIPGIEGVGPKTAAQLLKEFGSIDAMLANPEKIARVVLREKIASGAERLRINQRLVRLHLEQEMEIREDLFCRTAPDYGKIREIATEMEFRSMMKELEKRAGTEKKREAEPPTVWQPDLF